jgi:hypothetical protein
MRQVIDKQCVVVNLLDVGDVIMRSGCEVTPVLVCGTRYIGYGTNITYTRLHEQEELQPKLTDTCYLRPVTSFSSRNYSMSVTSTPCLPGNAWISSCNEWRFLRLQPEWKRSQKFIFDVVLFTFNDNNVIWLQLQFCLGKLSCVRKLIVHVDPTPTAATQTSVFCRGGVGGWGWVS